MAGTFRNPIDYSVGASFSKVGFNGFVIPHPKVHNMDTKFRRFSKEEMFKINFAPQNVMLNQAQWDSIIRGDESQNTVESS